MHTEFTVPLPEGTPPFAPDTRLDLVDGLRATLPDGIDAGPVVAARATPHGSGIVYTVDLNDTARRRLVASPGERFSLARPEPDTDAGVVVDADPPSFA